MERSKARRNGQEKKTEKDIEIEKKHRKTRSGIETHTEKKKANRQTHKIKKEIKSTVDHSAPQEDSR